MQIHVSPRNIPLTAAIHGAVANQITQLEGHGTDLLAAHVVLLHENAASPADRFCVKVHLAVAGPDIHAEHSASDLYAALEAVTTKLSRLLRKRKTATTKKTRIVAQKATESERTTGDVPRIIQKSLANGKSRKKATAAV